MKNLFVTLNSTNSKASKKNLQPKFAFPKALIPVDIFPITEIPEKFRITENPELHKKKVEQVEVVEVKPRLETRAQSALF